VSEWGYRVSTRKLVIPRGSGVTRRIGSVVYIITETNMTVAPSRGSKRLIYYLMTAINYFISCFWPSPSSLEAALFALPCRWLFEEPYQWMQHLRLATCVASIGLESTSLTPLLSQTVIFAQRSLWDIRSYHCVWVRLCSLSLKHAKDGSHFDGADGCILDSGMEK
jgi:hypothetical protein